MQILGKRVPLVVAHRGGYAHGRENSSLAVKGSLKYHPDVIEVDVRKSFDQVLFCRHGNAVMSIVLLLIERFLVFHLVRHLISGVETLEEILTTIQETDREVIILLDIKSPSIAADDLRRILANFNFQKVWIAAYTFNSLAQLRKGLGERYIYILNRPLVFQKSAVKKAQNVADVIQLSPSQWRKDNIDRARHHGLEVALFLLSPSSERFRMALKYKSLWLLYADVSSVRYCASEVI